MSEPDAPARRWRFEAIGTSWEIVSDAVGAPDVRARIARLVEEFDRTWSRFRPDSLVSALAGGGEAPLPPDGADMFDLYAELTDATAGAIDPLIGGALARRGYDADYSFVDGGGSVRPDDWRQAVSWTGGVLTVRGPALIDVGAVGKGRLVDLVAAEIARADAGECVVDASGDVVVRGGGERIALEHPYDPARAIGVIEIADAALCASAANRRAWGDGLHHVLDARTGEPVRTIAATWAVADTAMRADAASTALFFDGGPELAHRWDVEWVRMTTDGRADWSPLSTAEVFG